MEECKLEIEGASRGECRWKVGGDAAAPRPFDGSLHLPFLFLQPSCLGSIPLSVPVACCYFQAQEVLTTTAPAQRLCDSAH